jgi:hypothetical protein
MATIVSCSAAELNGDRREHRGPSELSRLVHFCSEQMVDPTAVTMEEVPR